MGELQTLPWARGPLSHLFCCGILAVWSKLRRCQRAVLCQSRSTGKTGLAGSIPALHYIPLLGTAWARAKVLPSSVPSTRNGREAYLPIEVLQEQAHPLHSLQGHAATGAWGAPCLRHFAGQLSPASVKRVHRRRCRQWPSKAHPKVPKSA